ncbi:hypothetical protein TCSYLVIO_001363 [Trypanosoma cruzi]|nr:hypothetical protein TCSYLVIO_001363 [Trypanosoma cruzi]
MPRRKQRSQFGTFNLPLRTLSCISRGFSPSIVQPTESAVPSTSITTDFMLAPMELGAASFAILRISEKGILPLCLMFFTFLRSRGGSFRARIKREATEGVTRTVATRFLTRSSHVTLRPFQSFVDLAMSSPIFLAFRPSGPTFGASDAVAGTSPPTALTMTISSWLGSNLGGISRLLSFQQTWSTGIGSAQEKTKEKKTKEMLEGLSCFTQYTIIPIERRRKPFVCAGIFAEKNSSLHCRLSTSL